MSKSNANKQYPVLRVFKDKLTGSRYAVGAVYETDDENRAAMMQGRGFIGDKIRLEQASSAPDAEKVGKRSKEEAKSKMEAPREGKEPKTPPQDSTVESEADKK